MKKIFGAKKEKEPPPSIQDASNRVRFSIRIFTPLYLFGFIRLFIFISFTISSVSYLMLRLCCPAKFLFELIYFWLTLCRSY